MPFRGWSWRDIHCDFSPALNWIPDMATHRQLKERNKQAAGIVRAIYADLAQRKVTRDCVGRTECCQFQLTGRTPQLTRGEALVAAQAFRATGRKQLPVSASGACPFLNAGGKCMIYDGRPFGCRTHFCRAAGGPMERREVLDLIRRLEAVDAELGGDGPHPIRQAVETALE
jgi:uncharacterized protein